MIKIEKLQKLINEYYSAPKMVALKGQKLVGKWNYEDACILNASIQMYWATREDQYRELVLEYLDRMVDPNGEIITYRKEQYNLDNVAGGCSLLFAYRETGQEKFLRAASMLLVQLKEQPRTKEGSFWHKKIYPDQVWLDGFYMAQPFLTMYLTRNQKTPDYSEVMLQFHNARRCMFDQQYQLYYHGYDESRDVFWADRTTGCSKNFWSRSIGWFLLALVDTAAIVKEHNIAAFHELKELYEALIKGVLQYRSKKDGLICQLIAYPEREGNYSETSATAMVIASILKAQRIGVLSDSRIQEQAMEMLESLIDNKIVISEQGIRLIDTVKVSGLGPADNLRRDGSCEYYLSEPKKDNCTVGIATVIMAYAEYLRKE